MLENSMQNRLVLCYTMLLINCHLQTHGENAVIRSTYYLAFSRIQPKIKKLQKIVQCTKNVGNLERGKVSTSEAMVDHDKLTSRR